MKIPLAPLRANVRELRLLVSRVEREIAESQERGQDEWNWDIPCPALIVCRRTMGEARATVDVVLARIGKADR